MNHLNIRSVLAMSLVASLTSSAFAQSQKLEDVVPSPPPSVASYPVVIPSQRTSVQDFQKFLSSSLNSSMDAARSAYETANNTWAGQQVSKRVEYLYLAALYADVLSARSVQEGIQFLGLGLNSPELAAPIAAGAKHIVLWSPATILAAVEIKKRFKHVGFVFPQAKGFVNDSLTYLRSYAQHPLVSVGTIKSNLRYGLRTAGRTAGTFLNYTILGGAAYLSYESACFSALTSSQLEQAEKEILTRMAELRKDLPDAQAIDQLVNNLSL